MEFFGYRFIGKTLEIDATRRTTSDYYARIAQLSQLIFIIAIPVVKSAIGVLFKLLRNGNQLDCNPEADRTSIQKRGQQGMPLMLHRGAERRESILGRELVKGYGTYEQWAFGIGWAAWLGFLCINDTAPDYLHLVKRFGLVGASQLPIHYLLAIKHPYGPFRLLSKNSSGQLLSIHLVTGRIIILLVTLHAILYSSVLLRMGIFQQSARQPNISVALVSVAIFGVIGITSVRSFRRRAYSWFYKVHIVGSVIVLPLLFFHVRHVRIYILECAAVVGLHALLRISGSLRQPRRDRTGKGSKKED